MRQLALFDELAKRGGRYVDWLDGAREQSLNTPVSLFARLQEEFRFTMDGAASDDNARLACFSSAQHPLSWRGERVFCNPPWADIRRFVELAATAELAVLLVPARTNARWFHRALALGAECRFFLGKPRFGDHRWNSPVDCLLLVFHGLRS